MFYDKIKRYRPEFTVKKLIKNSRRQYQCSACFLLTERERIRIVGVYEKQFYVDDYHVGCQNYYHYD